MLPLTSDQRALAERYVPLARSLAEPYCRACPRERDDLRSIAYLALCDAASRFDNRPRARFSTYASVRIIYALRDARRRERRRRSRDPGLGCEGHVVDDRPGPADLDDSEAVHQLIRRLSPDGQALVWLWLEAASLSDLARTLGLARRTVGRRLEHAFATVRGAT